MLDLLAKVARNVRASVAPFVFDPLGRTGACRRCGTCCRLVFSCPFIEQDNTCAVHRWRPPACRAFPRDRADLAELPPGTCGYGFAAREET